MQNPTVPSIFQDVVTALNAHNLAALTALVPPAMGWSEPDETWTGPVEVTKRLSEWFTAFPDLTVEVTASVSQGDLTMAEMVWRGKQGAPFHIPGGPTMPTRLAQIKLSTTCVLQMQDGIITEWKLLYDRMTLQSQLDQPVVPHAQPGESKWKHIRHIYRFHFRDPRRERLFLASISFFLTFAGVRIITHDIKNQRGPFRNIGTGGTHIHHMVWGILLLLAIGYVWLSQIGTGMIPPRKWMRATSILYGSGAALTLDEFALWLNLQDVYWTSEGRESIDAVVLFGGVLSIAFWGGPFFGGLYRFSRDIVRRVT